MFRIVGLLLFAIFLQARHIPQDHHFKAELVDAKSHSQVQSLLLELLKVLHFEQSRDESPNVFLLMIHTITRPQKNPTQKLIYDDKANEAESLIDQNKLNLVKEVLNENEDRTTENEITMEKIDTDAKINKEILNENEDRTTENEIIMEKIDTDAKIQNNTIFNEDQDQTTEVQIAAEKIDRVEDRVNKLEENVEELLDISQADKNSDLNEEKNKVSDNNKYTECNGEDQTGKIEAEVKIPENVDENARVDHDNDLEKKKQTNIGEDIDDKVLLEKESESDKTETQSEEALPKHIKEKDDSDASVPTSKEIKAKASVMQNDPAHVNESELIKNVEKLRKDVELKVINAELTTVKEASASTENNNKESLSRDELGELKVPIKDNNSQSGTVVMESQSNNSDEISITGETKTNIDALSDFSKDDLTHQSSLAQEKFGSKPLDENV